MNAQKELDVLIENLVREGRVPSLLLHSCCAPCSTYCIECLSEYFNITVFYYNPNIFPKEEYEFRKAEQKRFIESFPTKNSVKFIEGDYEPEIFYCASKGLEKAPEGGERCEKCFKLRLGKTGKLAKEKSFDYFATTLTISPLKNALLINQIGKEIEESLLAPLNRKPISDKSTDAPAKPALKYLPTDFKKKNGYLRSTKLSAEYDMYRQDFCGCEFSKKARDQAQMAPKTS